MLLKIFLGIVIVIASILVFAATKPNTFRVERSIEIEAAPEKVFPLINDFHQWPQWAPQDREDPAMKRTYSGDESGVGAISDWSGMGQTGAGRMTITESEAPVLVTVQADWRRPFVTRNINQFRLEPQGNVTRVTWSMQGKNLYMMKVMGIFVNMDKMMGRHFEDGLANLKSAAEK
jgi:carbon monoxide dehydrogenase subunit G